MTTFYGLQLRDSAGNIKVDSTAKTAQILGLAIFTDNDVAGIGQFDPTSAYIYFCIPLNTGIAHDTGIPLFAKPLFGAWGGPGSYYINITVSKNPDPSWVGTRPSSTPMYAVYGRLLP